MESRGLEKARFIASYDPDIYWETLRVSSRKGKRFMIWAPDGWVHFGAWPLADGAFLDHGDLSKRRAWRARHSKIMRGDQPAHKDVNSPSYYSWRILW